MTTVNSASWVDSASVDLQELQDHAGAPGSGLPSFYPHNSSKEKQHRHTECGTAIFFFFSPQFINSHFLTNKTRFWHRLFCLGSWWGLYQLEGLFTADIAGVSRKQIVLRAILEKLKWKSAFF